MGRKKITKMRGSKTCGYGAKKKHRGAGSRGGRGRAGTKKHMKVWLWKQGEALGKRGFKSLKQRNLEPGVKTINLRDLEKLAKGNEVDASELGYGKVLGSGELTKPLTIKAMIFSRKAKEKIEKAKGSAVEL